MRLLVLFFAFALTVSSQLSSWKVWHFQLPDGAYVSFAARAWSPYQPGSSRTRSPI